MEASRPASARGEGGGELIALFDALDPELQIRALTHSSWVAERTDSYGRLAFLGDAVLGLAIAEHLHREMAEADIGELTKVHGQAVSGRACAEVAIALGLDERIAAAEPERVEGGISADDLLGSERAVSSVIEAVIGACYLGHGFEPTRNAVVSAFTTQLELASGTLLDFKSALQELLARSGRTVGYEVTGESGPPHDRSFDVDALVGGEVAGSGSGRTKKAAEQSAAADALERLAAPDQRN